MTVQKPTALVQAAIAQGVVHPQDIAAQTGLHPETVSLILMVVGQKVSASASCSSNCHKTSCAGCAQAQATLQ